MTISDDFVFQLIQDKGLVSQEQADAVYIDVQSADNPYTAALDQLVEKGSITNLQIIEVLAEEFSMLTVDLDTINPSEDVLKTVGEELARRYRIFPLNLDGNQLDVASCDPLDVDAIDSLSHVIKLPVQTFLTTADAIDAAIDKYYKSSTKPVDDLFEGFEDEGVVAIIASEEQSAKSDEDATPIIRYVHMVINEAMKRRASDIHLEPLEKKFRVRFRVDGVLQEIESPPKRLQPSIISRIKLMANVSIAEKRVPQDGRIQLKTNARDIDLRVSVLPTVFGESIVMRILDKESLKLGLPQMGFFSDDQALFESLISMADGIFLVTGPTGSGKSTTLYSALNHINKPDRKIITVEDPVEYQLTGINQVGVRKEVGMTFSAALRSMLRQAPNVIMVGEIRDLETAEIAINASLTGHMVYSTLHTNDAPSAVSRLIDIGVKPFLVSASLRGALAQRLVRRICPDCKQPYFPEYRELSAIGIQQSQIGDATFYRGSGCAKCSGIGYKGRMGIFEIFTVSEEMQTIIYENKSLLEIRQKARELGMRSMRDDGIRKIMAGSTTIEEVLHVTVA